MEPITRIRTGGPADVPAVLAIFDEAVAWLAESGRPAHWGGEPFSSRAAAIARIVEWAAGGGLRVTETDGGEVVGALVLGARPPYVPPAEEPERYVEALVVSRSHAGRDVAGALLRHAAAEAAASGASLLRLDCWGGAPRLVAYYERHGFRRAATYDLEDGWHGQVLELRLPAKEAA